MTFYRRNLPHWHPEGKAIFLTWRLFGSLPRSIQAAGRIASAGVTKSRVIQTTGRSAGATSAGATKGGITEAGKRFRRWDAELDKGLVGPVWLRDARIARYVELAIHRGEQLGHYKPYAYVVMPNHVHALLVPLVPLARITRGIKGVSARDANAVLGHQGQPFWQNESFDH
ncbi:MAG TPA: hypothetical protein VFQ24_03740 [Terriglobia bacterium]|nr:hypothetical protein [Terriglobia bacterium]